MAKGVGLVGNLSGKLGNSVGYTIRNSNNKATQGFRVYQPVVKNPQTDAQMIQRIKMLGISNFYRQFRDVIQRGIEGVDYGDASRRAWLKMAMGAQFAGPWLEKGSYGVYPLPGVPVTRGSLPQIPLEAADVYIGWTVAQLPEGFVAPTTVGGFSQTVIDAGYCQAGDQITIMAGFISQETYDWNIRSFYVATGDTTPLANVGLRCISEAGDLKMNFAVSLLPPYPASGDPTLPNVLAVATSRDGNGVHLRSTSNFVLSEDAQAFSVYTASARQLAIDSYRTTSAASDDWQLTRAASGGAVISRNTNGGDSVSLVGIEQVGGYVMAVSEGGQRYYISASYLSVPFHGAYVNSLSTSTSTAPADATADNTIDFVSGGNEFTSSVDWWVSNGGSYSIFTTNPQ